jgi:hypothetical protein
MARVRIGPLSYGPGGRRGIHLGPFSASYNMNNRFMGGLMLLVIVVAIVQALWPVLLGAAVLTVIVLVLTKNTRAARRKATRQRQAEELQHWLDGPPPTLYVPTRFSEQWFAANVPRLHPGQIPVLFAEMKARGWSDQHIAQRLGRYLQQNPFDHSR